MPPREARLFFVPVYATAFFHARFKGGASKEVAISATRDFVGEALRLVQRQPYWGRSGGRGAATGTGSPR